MTAHTGWKQINSWTVKTDFKWEAIPVATKYLTPIRETAKAILIQNAYDKQQWIPKSALYKGQDAPTVVDEYTAVIWVKRSFTSSVREKEYLKEVRG